MPTEFLEREATRLPGNVPVKHLRVDATQWTQGADELYRRDARLLALWGTDERDRDGTLCILAAFLMVDHVFVLQHAMPEATPTYPSLVPWFPVADRLQRALHDLLGLKPDSGDTRPWLRHARWPETFFPLRRDSNRRADAVGPDRTVSVRHGEWRWRARDRRGPGACRHH